MSDEYKVMNAFRAFVAVCEALGIDWRKEVSEDGQKIPRFEPLVLAMDHEKVSWTFMGRGAVAFDRVGAVTGIFKVLGLGTHLSSVKIAIEPGMVSITTNGYLFSDQYDPLAVALREIDWRVRSAEAPFET